jgi:hypothetical protein
MLAVRGDLKASPFNGVKVFAATLVRDREMLGERVSEWIAANPRASVVEMVVRQSSDAAFHCISITVFYVEPLATSRA